MRSGILVYVVPLMDLSSYVATAAGNDCDEAGHEVLRLPSTQQPTETLEWSTCAVDLEHRCVHARARASRRFHLRESLETAHLRHRPLGSSILPRCADLAAAAAPLPPPFPACRGRRRRAGTSVTRSADAPAAARLPQHATARKHAARRDQLAIRIAMIVPRSSTPTERTRGLKPTARVRQADKPGRRP